MREYAKKLRMEIQGLTHRDQNDFNGQPGQGRVDLLY